jgi:S1-C subfamily serine protease
LILTIDGVAVDDPASFDYRFATKPLGGQAQVGVLRSGREVKVAVALETAPETPREETVIKARSPLLGAKVANLSPALAEELRLDSAAEGVAVTEVENGSVAQSFGFQKGDIVISVNNAKIANTQDLVRITGQPARLWRLTILRAGQEISAVFGG